MKRMSEIVFMVMLALSVAYAEASTNSSEITDMWWNPDESGWGVNVILQNDVAFLTFFVYDKLENPVWYTSDVHFRGRDGNGALLWNGDLFATTGPWFGGPFPPSSAHNRLAGSASFLLTSLDHAVLTYTVDGVTVTKALHRQTWTNENYSGAYGGGYSIRRFACNPSSLNQVDEQFGTITISQAGSNVTLVLANSADTCTFTGQYTQLGKLGVVQGNYSCVAGAKGTFEALEMTPAISGFTARVSGQDQSCRWQGYLGGIRRTS